MDGLECSEIMLSEISVDNEKYRFDSEFFQKKYMSAYALIKGMNHTTVREEISVLTDFHANGSYESIAAVFELLDTPDYAYMVRTTDLEKRDYVNDVKYVSKRTYEFLKKSKVYGGEVIINKIGSPGRTFLMPFLNKPVSLGMNQFMLKMNSCGKIDNVFLYVYLNTFIGKVLIERKVNGTVPLTIDKEAIKSIYIPCFSKEFQSLISKIIKSSNDFFSKSDELYRETVLLLEERLGFANFEEPNEVYSTKLISLSFLKSGRLDAEYYQLRYDRLFDILKKLNTRKLSEIVSIKKSIEPGSEYYGDVGVPFVRVSDLSKFEVSEPDIKIPKSLCVIDSSLFPEKDTILFSKDGSIGIAYKVEKDEEFVTSDALLHLKVKNTDEILPDYLTLVLNSKIVQIQAERDAGGSVIKHWKPDEIKNVVTPVLDIELQKQISKQAQHCFKMRKAAKELLNKAILIVETAIENGEEEAMKLF